MNSYEERQQARKDRYLAKAQSLRWQSDHACSVASDMASVIPFGQPILVGHHSERSDRAYRGRIDTKMRQSVGLDAKARYYEEKAQSVGLGGISSDDPDAADKLKEKLSKLKDNHAFMLKVNSIVRKKIDQSLKVVELMELGLSEEKAQAILVPNFLGHVGFASYSLSNSNANIRRIEKRIESLEKLSQRNHAEIKAEKYTYKEDAEENRVMFLFEGKPVEGVRNLLKRNGFRWSPRRCAWVRQLNNSGIWAGKVVMKALETF